LQTAVLFKADGFMPVFYISGIHLEWDFTGCLDRNDYAIINQMNKEEISLQSPSLPVGRRQQRRAAARPWSLPGKRPPPVGRAGLGGDVVRAG
jgi:hypothetical protein